VVEHEAVLGVTSNTTIFAKALSGGDAYGEQIATSDGDAKSVFLALAMRDVTAACDLLRPVWERTEAGDGYVSIEVDPNLADDTEAHDRASDAFPRRNRALEPAGQDPGHRCRRAGDRGDDRGGGVRRTTQPRSTTKSAPAGSEERKYGSPATTSTVGHVVRISALPRHLARAPPRAGDSAHRRHFRVHGFSVLTRARTLRRSARSRALAWSRCVLGHLSWLSLRATEQPEGR
jgi:Transaldolase/Fructose-6-phosphate aldolase